MNRALAKLQANAKVRPSINEMDRILALPRRIYPNSIDLKRFTKPGSDIELRPIQQRALRAIVDADGGFLPIGVGEGKTYVGLLAPTVLQADKAIYLSPAAVVSQIKEEYKKLQASFYLSKVEVLSYATLSSPDGTDLLVSRLGDAKRPVLVLDEAHKLRYLTSARTKRIIRFILQHPNTRIVVMSGTLTSRSISDFAHLAEISLKDKSPVPREKFEVARWSDALDARSQPSRHDLAKLAPLFAWSRGDNYRKPIILNKLGRTNREVRDSLRKSFSKRLRSAPGVVCSERDTLKASLRLCWRTKLEMPSKIISAIEKIQASNLSPDGVFLEDDLSRWRLEKQLACGFWYRWVWPNGIDHDWLDARNDWNRHVRWELSSDARQGYDSPALVKNEVLSQIQAGNSSLPIQKALVTWLAHAHKSEPPVEPVWISDYLIDATLAWVNRQSSPSLVWYESKAVANRLAEKGLTVYYAGDTPSLGNAGVSIRSHGTGLNMQTWHNQIVIEPPGGGATWEQMLGRTHRQGQQADTVYCHAFRHCPSFHKSITNALDDAGYIEHVTGVPQRLRYSDKTEPENEVER